MFALPRCWTRSQRFVLLGSLLYAGVFVFMLIVRPGSRQFYEAFFNTYQILPPLFASVCGLIHARRGALHQSRAQRVGWTLIALGCASFAAGQSTWTYYESVRGITAPFPSWADLGYLGSYPCLLAGIIFLCGSTHIAGRARLLLDGAITAGGVAMVSWHYLMRRVWNASEVSLLAKWISVASPLGDIAILFGALVLLNTVGTTETRLRRSFACIAGGIVLITFSDTYFTYMSLIDAYQTGSWADWGWSFGWMLIGYASLFPLWQQARESDAAVNVAAKAAEAAAPSLSRSGLVRVLTPYVAVGAAFAITAVPTYLRTSHVSNSVFLAGSALLLLVVLRQVLTLLENQHLTAELRAASDNLEHLVKRRTHQLASLHQLTKAVNNTLQAEQVLEAAAAGTRAALQADAVALWVLEEPGGGNSSGDLVGRAPAPLLAALRLHSHAGLHEHPDVFRTICEQTSCWGEHVEMVAIATTDENGAATTATFLRAPLRWQQRVVGMVGVLRLRANAFGPTDAELLESIGLEVGTALENARLYGAAVDAADRDPVTGLFNHRAIHQRLDAALKGAQAAAAAGEQPTPPVAVVMMDMDNFKLFNDTYGHPVGDQVLKRVAQGLRDVCDPQRHILGRYGGDEFVAVLPGADAAAATAWAQTLRERMLHDGFQRPGEDRVIPVTLSFGMATFPQDSANRHELLTIADANLYEAKNSDEGIRGTTQNQRENRALRQADSSFGVLEAMVTAVDNKDRYTRRHSEDVTEYALWVAEELGLSDETMRVIRVAGLLHDVGKISVPDGILRKPGRLTEDEFNILKQHPAMGALIVGAVPGMEAILDAVRHHHERWDGRGYPDGLAGENIPLLGRILAVADAFSAMTTDRPYRKGLDWETALDEIRAHTGSQFDPDLARAFLSAAHKQRHRSAAALRLQISPDNFSQAA